MAERLFLSEVSLPDENRKLPVCAVDYRDFIEGHANTYAGGQSACVTPFQIAIG